MHYVLTYDIGCNRRRRRVTKILLDFGWRVQRSVYEAPSLDEARFRRCLARVERELKGDDQCRIYALGDCCVGKVICMGAGEMVSRPRHVIVV